MSEGRGKKVIYREAKHLKRSLLTSKMFKIGNVSKDESKRRKEAEEEGKEREEEDIGRIRV